ncbi:MAG: hypothetical protein ACR2JU_00130 [Nocardioidaceae bacterium]
MSRGPGALQRWLLANLPHGEHVAQFDETAKVLDLAHDFYGAAPTEAQLTSVRRALRTLEAHESVTRWTTRIRRRGDSSGWTLPVET